MNTTYKCKRCKKICKEVQNPGDEYLRDLDLCPDCRLKEDHFRDATKMINESHGG